MPYTYGIPGKLIWSVHILVGLLLTYIGSRIINGQNVGQNLAILLVVLGSLATIYHAHLMYMNLTRVE